MKLHQKKDGDFLYDYHLDIDGSYGVQRKISIVVQLSDQEDYEEENSN